MDKLFQKENYFPLYQYKDIEKYLQNMANQGMFVVKFKNNHWYFKKDEPKNVAYCVTYTSETTDTTIFETTDEFYATNDKKGWELVVASSKMQIFANTDKEPDAIDKNNAENFQNIKNSLDKMFLFPQLITNICFLFMVIYQSYSMFFRKEVNNASLSILVIIMFSSFIIYNGYYIFDYIHWIKKSIKSINNSEGIIEKTYNNTFKLNMLLKTILTITFCSMIIFIPKHSIIMYGLVATFNLIYIYISHKNIKNYLIENEFPKMAGNIICGIYNIFLIIIFAFLIIVSGIVSG